MIRQLWTQENVQFNGKYYQLDGGKIEPRPAQPPPLWLGGWGELALKRAATVGDAWVPGPTAGMEKLLEAQSFYKDCLRVAGKDPQSVPTPLTREVVIAGTDDEAWEIAERHVLINYRDEYGGGDWKHPLIGGEDTARVDQIDAISHNRFLVGSPDTVIRQLQKFEDAFGVDHLICRLYFPGISHEFIMEELQLLAAEVIPAFRGA